MRTIKFRAWDKKENKMFHQESFMVMCRGNVFIVNLAVTDPEQEEETYVENPYCILMQYTGLKDKNGKEIYEGDIIEVWGEHINPNDGISTSFQYVLPVKYETKILTGGNLFSGFTNIDFGQSNISSVEIIGNIYENPDLLTN